MSTATLTNPTAKLPASGWIRTDEISIARHHRSVKPWLVARLQESMTAHGYNPAYPISIDERGVLSDGRHRLTAAQSLGLEKLPYILKPAEVSGIRFGLQCNSDGRIGSADDVFDLAELCYGLAQDGWELQAIADEIGWSVDLASKHKLIRERLHPQAWNMARSTKNGLLVESGDEGLVESDSTKVDWRETHFRALLKHLTWQEGDRAVMRAQVRVVRAALARGQEKDKRFGETQKHVTAKWLGDVSQRYAWYTRLALYMRDNLVQRVSLRDRIDLLKTIYGGVYGEKQDNTSMSKFDSAVKRLNEKALGVILYQDDALQRLPLIADGSIALVCTDPPYNVTDHDWDRVGSDDEYLAFTRQWLTVIRGKLAADYHLFFFCDADYQARIEREVLIPDGWPILSRVIWSNRSLPSGRGVADRFVRTWQMLFHCGTHALNWPHEWSDDRFDVQQYAAPNANTRDGGYHPTPKPQALIEHLIRIGSKPTDVVVDPFAGGGTTGAACAAVRQRRCILIERQDRFCANIEKRLQIKREA